MDIMVMDLDWDEYVKSIFVESIFVEGFKNEGCY